MRKRAETAEGRECPLFAVDGTTRRGSYDSKNELGALHSVSIWAGEIGLTLAQVATDDKSSEITTIPQALALVDLNGAIVAIDAMGPQTAFAKQIVDAKDDYVFALMGNQGTLFDAAVEYLQRHLEDDFQNCEAGRVEITDNGHGRTEGRTYLQISIPQDLSGAKRWPGIQFLGVAILYCIRVRKETVEARYFISILPVNVKQFARAVRSHWSIENTCQRCLEVTYCEDEFRIREPHFRENLAWLNRFTRSLLKQQQGKGSVAMKRRACGWSELFMLEVLTA